MAEIIRLLDPRMLLILALVFVPLERLLALRREQRIFRRLWTTDIAYQLINKLLINLLLLALIGGIGGLAVRFVPGEVRGWVAARSLWLQVPAAIVLCDLFMYATHRMFHAIPLLWRFHAVHHSIEELDWWAASRVHPVDQVLTKGISLVPLYILGFSTSAVGIFATIYMWQAVLQHANVRLPLGPLKWIVAGPQFHHWHHAADRRAYNTNFAAQLAVIDVLFGTCYLPGRRTPERYGVDQPIPTGYLGQLVHPFRPSKAEADPTGPELGHARP